MPDMSKDINPEHIGKNWIFFSGLGYVFATAMQTTSIRVGCGVSGWFYFFSLAMGYIAFSTKLRKVRERRAWGMHVS